MSSTTETQPRAYLPAGMQVFYALGMMGWSIMINLISVILVYLYLPPATSGLPKLITSITVFGIFNAIALITAGGRFVDALYDPFIAQVSDRSKNPNGRRIPIMKKAILPSLLFCCLVFYPLKQHESSLNIVWLVFTLVGFYVSTTTFIIPYNALLPELAGSSSQKVKLSTLQSLGYVFGIAVASNVFNLTDYIMYRMHISKINALQLSVFMLAILATVCMLFTVFGVNEKRYSRSAPSSVPIRQALRHTLGNTNFILFVVADFAYFISITIITSGLMYFVTVLLKLEEAIGNKLMITLVLVSMLFYPVVNYLAKKIGKKKMVLFSLALLAFVFLGVYYLGRFSFSSKLQIYGLICLAAIPMAPLNILPNAILAEIIEKDSEQTGQNKEAIYFAVRYFFVKIAQTLGIALFATFLMFGKDVNNDFGIRLNGILGCGLCLFATIIFIRFKEDRS